MSNQTNGMRPTLYAGQRFRTLRAAHWAAFSDLIGWRYVYDGTDGPPDFVITSPPWPGSVGAIVDGDAEQRDVIRLALAPMLARSRWYAGRRVLLGELFRGDGARSSVTVAYSPDPRRPDLCADLLTVSADEHAAPIGLLTGRVYPLSEITTEQNTYAARTVDLWMRAGRAVGYVPREART